MHAASITFVLILFTATLMALFEMARRDFGAMRDALLGRPRQDSPCPPAHGAHQLPLKHHRDSLTPAVRRPVISGRAVSPRSGPVRLAA